MENNQGSLDINEINSTLIDIKIHLHRVYGMVCIGVKENQMGFHETIIDDNDPDLREMMGTLDLIKEESPKNGKYEPLHPFLGNSISW